MNDCKLDKVVDISVEFKVKERRYVTTAVILNCRHYFCV